MNRTSSSIIHLRRKAHLASEAVRRAYDEFSFLMRSMDEDDTKPLLTNAMKITLDDVNEACEYLGLDRNATIRQNSVWQRLEMLANTVRVLSELIQTDKSPGTKAL